MTFVNVPPPDWPGAASASGGPSAERGMPKRGPGAVRDTSTPGLFRRMSMEDPDLDIGNPPKGCLLALAIACVLWATYFLIVLL